MTYPATNSKEASELLIDVSNQMHEIVNEDATTEVMTESGLVPSVRKALADTFLFQDPIAWNQGSDENAFNQLRTFDDNIYWAPTATTLNPIPMGATPIGDSNWKLAPVDISREWTLQELTRSQNEVIGGKIYPLDDSVLQNGDNVPSGTTHLRVLVGGKPTIVAMSPIASGVVSLLTDTGATIGSTEVSFILEGLNPNSDVRLEDFGVNAVVDATTSFIMAIEHIIDPSNDKTRLRLLSRQYNFNSRALIDCNGSSVKIVGNGDRSIINSSVVGQTTIDLYNTQRSKIKDFYMKGNGLSGAGGNGHAIALRDSDPDSGTIYPQNNDISGLRFFGFRGNDLDIDGEVIQAAPVFIGGGKFNHITRLLVDSCTWGAVIQDSGQTTVTKSTFVNCDYFGVMMDRVRSGGKVEDCDLVNCGYQSGATSSTIKGLPLYHGGVLFLRCSDTVTARDVRAKTSVNGVTAHLCNVVNIEDSTLAPEDVTRGAVDVLRLTSNKNISVNGTTFKLYNQNDPLTRKTKSLYIGVGDNIGDQSASIGSNIFEHACNSEYDIKIEGLGSSRISVNLTDNKHGNLTTSGLDVLTDDCILLEGVNVSGEITDNLFFVHESGNSCIISNTLRLVNAGFDAGNILIDRNKERAYLGGTFSNPIKKSKSSGNGLIPTSPAGIFTIDTDLVGVPQDVQLTTRGADPVFVNINNISGTVISGRAFNLDGTSYANESLNVYWSAEI